MLNKVPAVGYSIISSVLAVGSKFETEMTGRYLIGEVVISIGRHVFGEPEKMGSGSPQATVAAGSPDCGI